MAQDKSNELNTALSRQSTMFNLSLTIFLLVGMLLLLGAAIWKHDYQGGALADLSRDLGIAILISVFVTFSIERYSSNRLREHIAYDVLSAAYAKVVPEKIYTQVADNIFRSNVYRRKWEAHIAAKKQNLAGGTAVITATYSYDVENLNEHKIPFEVLAAVSLDVPIPNENIPKFNFITITDGHKSLIEASAEETRTLLTTPASGQNAPLVQKNLMLKRSDQEMQLVAQIHMAPRQTVAVAFQVERAIRVPGNFVLNATVPADGMKIIVTVEGFKLAVVPLHPDGEALRHQPESDTWQFDAGILPWQGFRFISEV